MNFPTTYSTFTIPTGAGPGTARITLDSTGTLTSYSGDGIFTSLSAGVIDMGPTDVNDNPIFAESAIFTYDDSTNPPSLSIFSPTPNGSGDVRTVLELFPGNDNTNTDGYVRLQTEGEPNAHAGLIMTGVLNAGSIKFGSVAITPSAPNTPTSASVTGLAMAGTTAKGFVTAANQAVGTQVTGVGVTGVTTDGMTIWATRTNTTPLTVEWLIMSE